jgi:hypothetical protein
MSGVRRCYGAVRRLVRTTFVASLQLLYSAVSNSNNLRKFRERENAFDWIAEGRSYISWNSARFTPKRYAKVCSSVTEKI